VGLNEHLVLYLSVVVTGLIALFVILFGVAMFRRKWPIPTWATGILVGLVFLGSAVGGALAFDTYPAVRSAYQANIHTTTRSVLPFTSVDVAGVDVPVDYQTSDRYYVTLHYFDHPDLTNITTKVEHDTLTIDDRQFDWHRNCNGFCIPDTYSMSVTVHAPNAAQLQAKYPPAEPDKPVAPENSKISD
jgi:hypothetical protein